MNALQLLTGPAAQAIGWALLHLLWQGTIVAAILAAVLALMSRQSANARYVVSCGALAMVFAMFLATAVRAYDPAAEPIATNAATSSETIKVSLKQLPVIIAETAAIGLRDRIVATLSSTRAALPTIVGIWLAGVVFLSSRLLVSWMRARKLVRVGSQPATSDWQRVAAHLSDALGLRRAVTLLESAAVEVPSVIGSLRPIILLPASALTGLTPEQIEMVLAHELAHIKRHDFLVNLLQAVVETLMFYHPAVWWMSRRVRIERENCCDDLAVAVCGNPIQYARALTRLEELRASALSVMVAANGGSLLDRVRRIAAGRAEGTVSGSRWAAAVVMLSILVIAVAIPSLPALAERGEKKAPKAKPSIAQIDVVVPAVDPDDEADASVDSDVDAEVDPTIDEHVDTDDFDFDFDIDPVAAPAALAAADAFAAGHPMIAPMAVVSPNVNPMPAVAPRAAMAFLAGLDADRDDDDDDYEDADDQVGNREIGTGGKLTVDELISLRAVGVTPEYLNEMRAIFPGLRLREVTSLKAVGVTADYIKEMRGAGYEIKSAKEATSLKAVGVTTDYIKQMRDAGLEFSARDVTSLKAVGVTPEYVKEMRDAGFTIKNAHDATSMRAVGVTSAYVRELRSAGFTIASAHDATSMRAVGVTPEYVKAMRDIGFAIKNAHDATSLKAVGVTPEWVRELKAAGVEFSAREASGLRALGVTAEFVRKLAAAGYANLSVRELQRLAAAGVDDDFIRDMEQYRKKN